MPVNFVFCRHSKYYKYCWLLMYLVMVDNGNINQCSVRKKEFCPGVTQCVDC